MSVFEKQWEGGQNRPTDSFDHFQFTHSHATQQMQYTHIQELNGTQQTSFENDNPLFESMQ